MFIRSIFDKGAIPVAKQMLSFTEERQRVLANNIANIRTPHYRDKDLPMGEFQDLLKEAIDERGASHPRIFEMGSSAHIRVDSMGRMQLESQKITEQVPLRRIDNNVSIERNESELAKNDLLHNVFNSLLNSEYKLIEYAITGR